MSPVRSLAKTSVKNGRGKNPSAVIATPIDYLYNVQIGTIFLKPKNIPYDFSIKIGMGYLKWNERDKKKSVKGGTSGGR